MPTVEPSVPFIQAWRAIRMTGYAQRRGTTGKRREKKIVDTFERRARWVRLWAAGYDPLKAGFEHVFGYV